MRLTAALSCLLLTCATAAGGASLKGALDPDALLSADTAFALLLPLERRGDRVQLEWNIAPGYYLYKHRVQVEILQPAGSKASVRLPAGLPHQDEHFGRVEIYRSLLTGDAGLPPGSGPVRLRLRWQGCADAGVCYPPQTAILDLPR